MVAVAVDLERARSVAGAVRDPELPMLTIEDLGILRSVSRGEDGAVVVELTPTYSGCPALDLMRREVARRLDSAGFRGATVRTVLHPAWTSDWLSERGRRALADAGIAPPGLAPVGPALLSLEPAPRVVECPRCGVSGAVELSAFGATACRALWRCPTCGEPFERFKEH